MTTKTRPSAATAGGLRHKRNSNSGKNNTHAGSKELRGQMQPFEPADLATIRGRLKKAGAARDMALLNVGVDTMLRASDLVRLTVDKLRDHRGEIVRDFGVRQKKTGEPVLLALSDRTRASVAALIEAEGKYDRDFLFTRDGQPHGQHMTEMTLRRLVKRWSEFAGLDPAKYSGHSLRRTKAVLIYHETHNYEAVRQLLGHTTLAHTVAYLGVNSTDVLNLSRRFDI